MGPHVIASRNASVVRLWNAPAYPFCRPCGVRGQRYLTEEATARGPLPLTRLAMVERAAFLRAAMEPAEDG